jgi:hypothetical protein
VSGSPREIDDVMKYLGWFLFGFCLILVFQACYIAQYHGDWTVLVRVGAIKPHREHITAELGPLTCVDPLGHDGQVNYLIARDPFDRHDTGTLIQKSDNPPYRFRRVLYPLLAGGCGLLGPRATVSGLVFWIAVGGGLIVAACAFFRNEWKLPGIVFLFALLNPGIYLSAQVLTNDVLAMGLALVGMALWCRHQDRSAGMVLAAAVLVRETSILVSLVLAVLDFRERGARSALTLLLTSGLPYLCWSLWVRLMIPGGDGLENLSLPLVGFFSSLARWVAPSCVPFWGVLILFPVLSAGIAWKTDNRLIRLSCLAWIGLAMILSDSVWEHPGNALRAISPLWIFVALGYGTCKKQAPPPEQTSPVNEGEKALALHTG